MEICIMYCSNKSRKRKFIKTMAKLAFSTASIIIAMGIPSTVVASGVDVGVSKANSIGYQIWKIVKCIAMWTMAALAAKDILETLNEGDYKRILKILFTYGLAFACVSGIIKFFTWIDTLINS